MSFATEFTFTKAINSSCFDFFPAMHDILRQYFKICHMVCAIFWARNQVQHHQISLDVTLGVSAHMALHVNLEDDFAAFRQAGLSLLASYKA